jgi:hypothetical protein
MMKVLVVAAGLSTVMAAGACSSGAVETSASDETGIIATPANQYKASAPITTAPSVSNGTQDPGQSLETFEVAEETDDENVMDAATAPTDPAIGEIDDDLPVEDDEAWTDAVYTAQQAEERVQRVVERAGAAAARAGAAADAAADASRYAF